jgi:hypothetical protein
MSKDEYNEMDFDVAVDAMAATIARKANAIINEETEHEKKNWMRNLMNYMTSEIGCIEETKKYSIKSLMSIVQEAKMSFWIIKIIKIKAKIPYQNEDNTMHRLDCTRGPQLKQYTYITMRDNIVPHGDICIQTNSQFAIPKTFLIIIIICHIVKTFLIFL